MPLQQPVQQQVQPRLAGYVSQRGAAVAEGMGGVGGRPSLQPREVKLQKPSTFAGKKSEVDNFLFEMRQYCDSVNLGVGSDACRFVVSHLKGDALTWWRSYSRDSLSIFDHLELAVLLDEIKLQFSDVDEEMKLRDRLLSLRQTGSVSQFVTDFKQLQLKLGQHRLDDEVSLHLFLVGLKNFTRQQVVLQRPTSFEDAVVLAERAEQSLYWMRSGDQRRGFYKGENARTVSQYSNSRYKGPAPMVLGNVQKSAGAPRGAGKATVTCYHCGRTGHYKRDCWQLNGKPNGKPGAKRVHAVQSGGAKGGASV